MRLYMEKDLMALSPHRQHLTSASDLVTTYEARRAGFVSLALEKNRQGTPFVQQARSLKAIASTVARPKDLLGILDIEPALVVAAGVSDKAANHLHDEDKQEAISLLIRNYLEPQGDNWVEELVFRFLLTRGDALGGMMRNIAGTLAQRKTTRAIISALGVLGQSYSYLDTESNKWLPKPDSDADIELRVKGLSWRSAGNSRTLSYNIKVPAVNKNVDLCLFNSGQADFANQKISKVTYAANDLYLALGELKGGIDPAGADEHWKTASTALKRIGRAFGDIKASPYLFFIGAAIERDMANEIWVELETGTLTNAANLTNDNQIASICLWLCRL